LAIPYAFVLGLAVLLLAHELWLVVPGAGAPALAALAAPVLALPALLTAAAIRLAARDLHRGRRPGRAVRVLSRLAPATLPGAYCLLLGPGTWIDLVDGWAQGSYFVHVALLLLPLVAAESARVLAEARAEALLPAARPAAGTPVRFHLAFVGLITAPVLLLGLAGDLTRPHREVFVFLVSSSAGLTLGMFAFALTMLVILPLVFRVLFGLTRRLPEPPGAELRATAAALGFPGRAVLWYDSGLRTVNALLLGPLPWPRYLVLTDGLVAALDLQALRGVVAHEVGHAQAGHPAMLLALFFVVPMLVGNWLQRFDLAAVDGVWLVAAALAAGVVVWRLLRLVAHRFEHEADVLSAIALGGAEPCIRALVRVGQVLQQEPGRASLLHPSERDRVRLLQGFAADAAFRARFALRGLRLRRAIAGLLVLSTSLAALAWYDAWPAEKAAMQFHRGDFAAARAQAEVVGTDVRAHQRDWWQEIREDIDAATAIAGDGGDWEALRPLLAAEGWRRGIETLLQAGPAAARRWFALATEDAERSPLRRCLLLYCEAARDQDLQRLERIKAHIRRIGYPGELQPVFGA
jgi:Zn-dependent protease with chaperone function